MVRIMSTEIHNFKNVRFGEIKYPNQGSLNNRAVFDTSDITGIYGQNGSGKTALVDALDIVKHVTSEEKPDFKEYSGVLSSSEDTEIITVFFVQNEKQIYKVKYSFHIRANDKKELLEIYKEKLEYWSKGSAWKAHRELEFENPYYDDEGNMDIIQTSSLAITSETMSKFKSIKFLSSMQPLAIYCAGKQASVFFNRQIIKGLKGIDDAEADVLRNIIESIMRFSLGEMHIIKVKQLGAINNNNILPLNMHQEDGDSVIQGCLPLFINGQGEIPENAYKIFSATIEAINIAIRSIIPNLQIELQVKNEVIKEDGTKHIQLDVFSVRGEDRFLMRYESEGIKRIISILNFLISVYNNQGVCLVVDELDSGIFEYLLGELLGFMKEKMKGQLIFTSHNLRVLEKLSAKNIYCSTINPNNRYIMLTGIESNNNKRDFYIRTLTIGGQKEELYDDKDLIAMGYAFRKAGRIDKKSVNLTFSDEFETKLRDAYKEKEE